MGAGQQATTPDGKQRAKASGGSDDENRAMTSSPSIQSTGFNDDDDMADKKYACHICSYVGKSVHGLLKKATCVSCHNLGFVTVSNFLQPFNENVIIMARKSSVLVAQDLISNQGANFQKSAS